MSEKLKVIVRLSTEVYWDSKGNAVFSKKLTNLKRMSRGCLRDVLTELDCDIELIQNLMYVKDGVYEITWVNVRYDYESGCADSWEYKLIEYNH